MIAVWWMLSGIGMLGVVGLLVAREYHRQRRVVSEVAANSAIALMAELNHQRAQPRPNFGPTEPTGGIAPGVNVLDPLPMPEPVDPALWRLPE